MTAFRVIAVVVTYDRPDELRQVIAALQAQTRRPDHLIVFDNGGPIRARSQLDYPGIEVVESGVNLGGAGGFARGLALALLRGADWVWLMDDDAIPEPTALAALLTILPNLPANAGALCSGVKEQGCWARRHRRYLNRLTGWERSLSSHVYEREAVEIDTGSFVGFLVSAAAVRQAGLPNVNFFLAYDDTDYSLRLQDAGWRLWLVPGSVIQHLKHPDSRLHRSRFAGKHYYNIRNRLIVKRCYSHWRWAATVESLLYALLLWGVSAGWRSFTGWTALWRATRDGLAVRWGTPDGIRPSLSRGAVILRTQGHRPALLAEALASVACQTLPMTAFVVVHGDRDAYTRVETVIRDIPQEVRLLQAPDTRRHRGYPLNLALDRIYDTDEEFDFLCFLDDDDLLLPGFCARLTAVMRQHQADVVYAASQRQLPDAPPSPGYSPLPPVCLLVENFMPINSYIIRFEAIRAHRLYFDESLEVLEDWNFLHRLLALRLKFQPLGETLSAFRITGDGNTPDKRDQALWDRAWEGIQGFLNQADSQFDQPDLISSLRHFDFSARDSLTPSETQLLKKTEVMIAPRFAARRS